MRTIIDFSDAAAVRELAAAGERLVCLQFPEGLGSLYCHSCLLSMSSPVLRNVLEDTQRADGAKLCTIPLAGDSDVSTWKLALGLICRLKGATITLDNAQALLLLAHKYDMDCITAKVGKFLLSTDTTAADIDSKLKRHLSKSTVSSWLATANKCGLEQHVQLCIDYILNESLPVNMELLASVAPAHADLLLKEMKRKHQHANSKVATVVQHAGARKLTGHTCWSCNHRWIARESVHCCKCKGDRKSYVDMYL